MNLRGLDLNLLEPLQVLLEEGHLSRAGRRVDLSQPAMSSALQRCRQLLRDRLLERNGAGMRLMARGEALQELLSALLIRLSRSWRRCAGRCA